MTARLTAAVLISLPLATFVGCDAELGGRTGGPVMNEAQQATDAMSDADGSAPPAGDAAMPPAPAESQPEAAASTTSAPPVGTQSQSHVGQRSKEILNAKEIVADPNWTVAASDPSQVRGFSAPGTAFNRAVALSGTVGLEQWVQHEQALNGKYPSYQQLQDYLKQNSVDMPALRVYQHYGYDETTGQVVILENRAEKEGRRSELGLDPNE